MLKVQEKKRFYSSIESGNYGNKESVNFRKIAVAVDGSETSIKAANHATHLAKMHGAELTLLHVIEDVKQGGSIGLRAKYGDTKLVQAFKNVRTEAASEFMSPLIESARRVGLNPKSEVLQDEGESEADAIVKYA